MINNGLFSTLFIEELKKQTTIDDAAQGRMATLAQTWTTLDSGNEESLWDSFLKQALGYVGFVPPGEPDAPGVYPLYEDWGFSNCISILILVSPGSDIDSTSIGRFYPAKLLAQLKKRKLNWGILTDGAKWRLYSVKSSRPYEDFVELPLDKALSESDEAEYGLFERFFHMDSFVADEKEESEKSPKDESLGFYKCKLDADRDQSEKVLDEKVKNPFLAQVDEVLQYICNGFIHDTQKSGEEYTEEEREEIFESAVKLIYRSLFLFYAEARRLLPSDPDKVDLYQRHSIQALCEEARKFRWGERQDTDQYDLWKHFKGLINAVNDGDPEYGIMGYNGGLFDDDEERFLGQHQLRNDFLSRALYLLAFVEPLDNESDQEYAIPYKDLEVRHLGELYENILEYTVQLADADRYRRRSKKGVSILLASQTTKQTGDTLIKKGEVYFGESALERKQTGSYYTPESLVRFLNEKTIIRPLHETFDLEYRQRFKELIEEAKSGHDSSTRRGAAQAAAALVERFVEEKVLKFKVCDPAMGSGHFLVDAANQMAGLVVSLFEEVPYVEGALISVNSHPNEWRRYITRHCIYGVDLNPLSVNLAKLSLWLNCFASDHKLTFLDYHLRCGNSLIGIRSLDQLALIPKRKKDSKKKTASRVQLSFEFTKFTDVLGEAAHDVSTIALVDEDDTDAQKAILQQAIESMSDLKPLADLYTAYLMDPSIQYEDYKDLFERLAKGMSINDTLNFDLPEIMEKTDRFKNSHHFYHWPLEFPDIFGPDEIGGFSATVGNPPWDIIKANSQEFFTDYNPLFRSYKKQEANLVAEELMIHNPAIAQKWEEYCNGFAEQGIYFKEPISFSALGKGDINTFKLFLERFFALLTDNGRIGIIIPSGIYTDQGCQPLRELFFGKSQIDYLYCFENRLAIFNIHRSFKFVLFGAQKTGATDSFKCAFMEHNPERLSIIDSEALAIDVRQVKMFSPDTLSIFEFREQNEINIISKQYQRWPLLGNHSNSELWHIGFHREFHMSDDSDVFNVVENGLPLFEGKRIWQFDSYMLNSNYYIDEEIGRRRVLGSVDDSQQIIDYQKHRVVFRKIAANTNERTLISTVIPPKSFTGENLTTGKELFDPPILLFISAVLNSFSEDFIIRMRVTTAINMYHVNQIPLPRLDKENEIFKAIVSRCARLVCIEEELSDLWSASYSIDYQVPSFWYPDQESILKYGPVHEQEIRRHLYNESNKLTPEWGPHCSVRDRLPDRRDTGDRAQLRAEIDAYVAHLYGLSRDDFDYILDTFPVLKKKELKAFGEFMSKRKCLEEYDRLSQVLGELND
jgi:hypothetical protein